MYLEPHTSDTSRTITNATVTDCVFDASGDAYGMVIARYPAKLPGLTWSGNTDRNGNPVAAPA
jgi:hypothetical protein